MDRRTFLAAAIIAAIPSIPAASGNTPGVTPTEIKIGATFPFSGPGSVYASVGRGMMAYIDHLNAQGGINGRKINLVALDDAYSPPKAVEQVRRLVESEEVAFIFGSLGTATNAATIKYLNTKKVPDLFIMTGGSRFTDFKQFPYTTTGLASLETEGRIYAKYVAEQLPEAKIALLYQNDDLGRDFLNAFKFQFKDNFATKVTAASYESTEPTVDSQVVTLKNSGADVLMVAGTSKFTAQAIRKAHEIGWRPVRIINAASSSIAATLQPAGLEASVGVLSASYLKDIADTRFADDPGVKSYRALMTKYAAGADLADFNYMSGVNTGMLLEQVLKQCGDDLSRENVLKQARSIRNFVLPLTLPGIVVNTNEKNSQAFTQLQMQRFNGTGWEQIGSVIGIDPQQ